MSRDTRRVCTFQDENCDTSMIQPRPEEDLRVLELHKGGNARFYRYLDNRANYQRVRNRQDTIKKCVDALNDDAVDNSEGCLQEPRFMVKFDGKETQIDQILADQVNTQSGTSNGGAGHTHGSELLPMPYRSRENYAAFHEEGQLKEARDRVEFLQSSQRHERECSKFDTLCGADTAVTRPLKDSGISRDPEGGDLSHLYGRYGMRTNW